MEQTLLIFGLAFAAFALAVIMAKYLTGDFYYTDEIMFYDKIKQEYIVKRTFHSGKVEIIKKQYK